jgi:hypothetical protein
LEYAVIKVGDEVIHLRSHVVGEIISVDLSKIEYALHVEFRSHGEHHDKFAYYTADGKVWDADDEETIIPATKLHKLLYGIED